MQIGKRMRRPRGLSTLIAAALAAALLGACGSSSSGPSATTLLHRTFTGSHEISSGVVHLQVTITPSGSSLLSGPITLSFGGPFQSRGTGKLPASDFTAAVSALGHNGSLGIISTGTGGYVTMSGTGYKLPQASFEKLESGFSGLGGSGAKSGAGALGGLGIEPLTWLTNPTVVGTETIAGVQTTHIHAGVDTPALLANLSTLLSKTSGVGVKGVGTLPKGISASEQTKLAAAIHNPSVDVWMGTGDTTLRKLEVSFTVPISGSESTQLGGLTSAHIDVTLQYGDLNQPQTISVPTTIQPYSVLSAKLSSLMSEVSGVLSLTGASGSSSGSGNGGSSSSSSSSTGGSSSEHGELGHFWDRGRRQPLQPVHPGGRRQCREDAEVLVATEQVATPDRLRVSPARPLGRLPRVRPACRHRCLTLRRGDN